MQVWCSLHHSYASTVKTKKNYNQVISFQAMPLYIFLQSPENCLFKQRLELWITLRFKEKLTFRALDVTKCQCFYRRWQRIQYRISPTGSSWLDKQSTENKPVIGERTTGKARQSICDVAAENESLTWRFLKPMIPCLVLKTSGSEMTFLKKKKKISTSTDWSS